MKIPRGKFVWFELLTRDAEAALKFYGRVLGYESVPSPLPDGGTYHLLQIQGRGVAGIYSIPKGATGMAPGWLGYISTPDIDHDLPRLEKLGGTVQRAAQDIPQVGRFAPVSDPQGAAFFLFQPTPPPGEMTPPTPGSVGTVGWCELRARDWKPELTFYSELFGWKRGDVLEMGPQGQYQLFHEGDRMAGGMMNLPDKTQPPHWMFFFTVDSIAKGIARVTEQGGLVKEGPIPVPGGSFIAHCQDPEGAPFSLTSAT